MKLKGVETGNMKRHNNNNIKPVPAISEFEARVATLEKKCLKNVEEADATRRNATTTSGNLEDIKPGASINIFSSSKGFVA